MRLYIDFETLSACDLPKSGSHAYASHHTTGIICLAFAVEGERPRVYIPPYELTRAMMDPKDVPFEVVTALPEDVRAHVLTREPVVAHNVEFDLPIWNNCTDWPALDPAQMDDTMARAGAMALPQSLGPLGDVLGVRLKKNPMGTRLINQMSKPPFKTSPELLKEMVTYCAEDVMSTMEIDKHLSPLSPFEREVWLVNLKANLRGLKLDGELISHAIYLAGQEDIALGEQAQSIAGLSLSALRSPKQILEWAQSQGENIPSLNKADLATYTVKNPLVQQVLDLRAEVCKASIKKFDKMLSTMGEGGRARGNHVYHRATTGRFAGSGVQIQNLPRPAIMDCDDVADHLSRTGELKEGLGVGTKTALSSLLRSAIVAEDGKEFYCADFSSIESRVLFWLADDQKGLDVYRKGDDLYCVTASGIFGHSVNKTDHPRERSIGKVAVLSLGYAGGVKAFGGMCEQMGVDLQGVDPQEVVDGYRDTYAKTRQFWKDCEQAGIDAIENVGSVYTVGKCAFRYFSLTGALVCKLPSGRKIRWPDAEIIEALTPWGAMLPQIQYKTLSLARKWRTRTTHGGDIAQSLTQATARDLLAHSMVYIDRAGFPVVLHVHDEIMAEVPKRSNRFKEFMTLMESAPAWAQGLPVKAEGWVGGRYQK